MDSAEDTATDHFTSHGPKLGHQPPLDGMRGVAMSAVLLAHGAYGAFASFAASVDVFFVVSGFLITTLLLEEDRRVGAVNLRNFYKRRALRLLPMLYIVIGVTLVGVLVIMQVYGADSPAAVPSNATMGELWQMTVKDSTAGAFYVYHVFFPVGEEVTVGGWPQLRIMIQLWSLSVEEHYYVFGVLLTLWAVHRRKVRLLMGAFAAAWVFVGVARSLDHVGPLLAWYQRPDSILLGVGLAFVNARLPSELSARFLKGLGHAATLAGVVFATTVLVGTAFAKPFGLHVPFSPEEGGSLSDGLYWGQFGFSLCAMATAVMILAIVRCERHWMRPVLSWNPFQVIGVRSYGIYVIHVPLFFLLINGFKDHPWVAVVLYLPLLVVLTELGHRCVERPLMKSKAKQVARADTRAAETRAVTDAGMSDVGAGPGGGQTGQ